MSDVPPRDSADDSPRDSTGELWLDCYQMQDPAPEIVPGRGRRDWMDASPGRYAYRCLPLTMANSTGWDILCPGPLTIEWDGQDHQGGLSITSEDEGADLSHLALSHFGQGIVTFHTGWLFRTPPGWAVWTMGSPNHCKDGIAPLSGLVETDWLPFPFTMNWKMTRPGKVHFEKGEPFCFLTLSEHKRLEEFVPRLKWLGDNPELAADYTAWTESRADFLDRLLAEDPETVEAGWQRHYMKGERPGGEAGSEAHITRRRLRPPQA